METARGSEQLQRERVDANLYYHRIALAHREWLAGHRTRAVQILEECRDDVRRGWEWQYLNGLFHPELLSFQEHRLPVRAVAFSPDGRLLASASGQWGSNDPGEVIVWDVASGTENFRWKASTGPVTDLAFSSDGRLLAAGTGSWTQDDNTVKVWDVTSGRELRPLVSRVGRILSVAFCRRSPIDCRRRGPRRPTMGWDPSIPASRST